MATKTKTAARTTKAKKTARKSDGLHRIGAPAHRVDLSKYKPAKSAEGNSSLHCGDEVAVKLVGKTLDDVYKIAAKVLSESERALRTQYKHLNVGMQRMNLGNRIRGAAA